MWSSEDIILVGGERDRMTAVFLLADIALSDYLDPFHPVQDQFV